MKQYMNAKNRFYIEPFKVERVLENGQIWVRKMRYTLDRTTGEGTVGEPRKGWGRVLLTKHEDGHYFSKTGPLYKGYKFEFADEPKVWADPHHLEIVDYYRARGILLD